MNSKPRLHCNRSIRPNREDEDVRFEVEACGVCHSDLHVASRDWPQVGKIIKKPLILGHEVAGRVVETGTRVRTLQKGGRVGVPWSTEAAAMASNVAEEVRTFLCVRKSPGLRGVVFLDVSS